MDIKDLKIKDVREGLWEKKFSAREVTDAYLGRIKDKNPGLNAYLRTHDERARASADKIDKQIAREDNLPSLAGVPVALKDNMMVEGEISTAGSKILENYKASYTGGAVARLESQGAVILGKTNLDEFAMGSSTENSAYGPAKNPHDTTRVPGGSSGGSAVAVAADLAVGSYGSDTGGSIRQPAALTGIVGMKPTYGTVSRSGLIAMASSLDQIGPFAKSVEDARILFDAVKGYDPMDATSAKISEEPTGVMGEDEARSLTIGVPKEYFIDGLDPKVSQAVEAVIETYKKAGWNFKEISLPHTKYALSTYYIVMPAEVSANLARFDGIRYERPDAAYEKLADIYTKTRGQKFGKEVQRRIMLGTFVLSSGYYDAYYAKAQKVRTLISGDFSEAWTGVDAILAPTTPSPAFKIGEKSNDPLSMYLEDIFTIPVNLAGLPAISIPCRNLPSGSLPIGFQLIAPHFKESRLFALGEWYEREVL